MREKIKVPLENLPSVLNLARRELLKKKVKEIHNQARQIIIVEQDGEHNFYVEKKALSSWDEAQLGVNFHFSNFKLESIKCSESAQFVMNSITLPSKLKQLLLTRYKKTLHLGKKPASLEK